MSAMGTGSRCTGCGADVADPALDELCEVCRASAASLRASPPWQRFGLLGAVVLALLSSCLWSYGRDQLTYAATAYHGASEARARGELLAPLGAALTIGGVGAAGLIGGFMLARRLRERRRPFRG